MKHLLFFVIFICLFYACKQEAQSTKEESKEQLTKSEELVAKYTPFTLTSDLSHLSDNQKEMIEKLIEASKIMDDLFWWQAYGDKQELLNSIQDSNLHEFVKINYGPWDRLENNESFIDSIGSKPLGANFYPENITKEKLENGPDNLRGLYTMVRENEQGKLEAIPYSVFFEEKLTTASNLLKEAAEFADDRGFKDYLIKRAEAFLSNNYYESDMAWMDMTNNDIDLVIGPIETYEDQLIGAKAAFEAYVLVKDKEWSERLSEYAKLLPQLQEGLPVEDAYKAEVPGTNSQLNAYDVIYYAGDCNAGSKTIAINLPNDERVQLSKGSRRLQLKNAMRAKYEKILVPISKELITEDQQKNITFDAFFSNTMFHEVAHGLGIKNLVGKEGTVREALKEHASALEEGKADILGLYMITKMAEMGEFPEDQLMDNYVTFLAGIFRSARFGSSSAHGKANMLRFNYFQEHNAFQFDEESKTYSVDFEAMKNAMNSLSNLILTIQGDGDYEQIDQLMKEKGIVSDNLQEALDRVNEKGIPSDIVFNQGVDVLGL